jgi:hypothetical protein
MDIECIVGKIYQHFSIYTVPVQTIKDVYEFVDVGLKNILDPKKPLCFHLFSAVRGIVVVHPAVAFYFLLNGNRSTIGKYSFHQS